MGQVKEVDALSDAIIETEREIAGEAWDIEDTERLDGTGNRSLEALGDGLEGQHEADEDELDADGEEDADGEGEAEDADGDGEEDGEAKGEAKSEAKGEGETAPEAKDGQKDGQQPQRQREEGRVPSGKLREEAERRRLVEAERDRLKQELEQAKAQGANRSELDQLRAEIAALKQRPLPQAPAAEPAKVEAPPDIFENPTGFADYLTKSFQSELLKRDQQMAAQRVETSMAIAHGLHKEVFETAFSELNKLNPQNPDDRVTVQRIYNSPNPGEELVKWHRRASALARVGSDVEAYEARIREETRQALLKDPDFRKALVAEIRGEAQVSGENGGPRTTTRLPRSLNRAAGSNVGGERIDPRALDDSEQAVADSAWRT